MWLEEYREMCRIVAARIDLTQRNSNLLIIVVLAGLGFIGSLVSRDGLEEVLLSGTAIAIPVVLAICLGFAIRHIDHDANMIDASRYIEEVVRPNIVRLSGPNVLGWEEYLRLARRQRLKRYFGTSMLGGDLAIIYLVALPFVVSSWWIVCSVQGYAGELHVAYLVLTVVDTAILVWLVPAVWLEWRAFEGITAIRRAASS